MQNNQLLTKIFISEISPKDWTTPKKQCLCFSQKPSSTLFHLIHQSHYSGFPWKQCKLRESMISSECILFLAMDRGTRKVSEGFIFFLHTNCLIILISLKFYFSFFFWSSEILYSIYKSNWLFVLFYFISLIAQLVKYLIFYFILVSSLYGG
jgi:hypothetical protein